MTVPVLVWAGLVAATVVSWLIGDDHGLGEGEALVTLVVAIGFVKAWAVGRWFMELRDAPLVLSRAFSAWVAGSFAIVVAFQHLA